MIELNKTGLTFSFPEVHPDAICHVSFKRTLRVPEDDKDYPLPPSLGQFQAEHLDDFAEGMPEDWVRRGGVMLPMFTADAMWINFTTNSAHEHLDEPYPFAVRIAAGKINAVTGEAWIDAPPCGDPQDYVVLPTQPWLDGFATGNGTVNQFVATPLGSGATVEEQLTNMATHGGLQIQVFPMRREVFEARFPKGRHSEIAVASERMQLPSGKLRKNAP